MSRQLLPLDSQKHRLHGWKSFDHFRFASKDLWSPLLIAELFSVLPLYLIGFAARPDSGYQLVAVQGLSEGENLYLEASGRWQVSYIPSHYRSYPFAFCEMLIGDKRVDALAFDYSSALYREFPNPAQGEHRFFNDQGQLDPMLQKVVEFLKQCAVNRTLTLQAVDAIVAAGLLEPWPLSIQNLDAEQPLLQGLYRINASAFNELDGQTLKSLSSNGALTIIYAQIFSMPRLSMLLQFRKSRISQSASSSVAPLTSVDALFGEGQDDIIRF